MLKSSRISAIFFRHLIPTFRDPMRLTDMVYWPFVDLILFGFLAVWSQQDIASQGNNFTLTVLLCVACWYLIYRSTLEICRNMLVEVWDGHIVNLFASPLSIMEFIFALMLIGIVQAIITFFYSITIIWLLFSYNIFSMLHLLVPFIPLFICTGWILGVFICSIVFYFGKTVEILVWSVPWFVGIISGAYYPLTLFPKWISYIAFLFPSAWLFDGIRQLAINRTIPVYNLAIAAILCIAYLIAALFFLKFMFKESRKKGLTRLE